MSQRKAKAHRRAAQASEQTLPGAYNRRILLYLAGAAFAGLVALVLVVTALTGRGDSMAADAALPRTSDYHSLSVSPSSADEILLGTHQGLFRSTDAGMTWRSYGLKGKDAMNLARSSSRVVWVAGHNVFAKSTDGGGTWQRLKPPTLPSLDLHGFAVDPARPDTLYAAVAGQGLYRSRDGGQNFNPVSLQVGRAVMALAVTSSGEILAGDMQRGLLGSRDGRTWREILNAQIMGLAINPRNRRVILAVGRGIFRSSDGGANWRHVLELQDGAGPVAWAPSDPQRAYVVGFDRKLYRSNDGGATWAPVTA